MAAWLLPRCARTLVPLALAALQLGPQVRDLCARGVSASWSAERGTAFVGECTGVRLRLELPRAALQWAWALPYQQAVDWPLELVLPWLDSSGAWRVERGQEAPSPGAPADGALGPSLVVQGIRTRARRADAGASERLAVEIDWDVCWERPGEHVLPGGFLRTWERGEPWQEAPLLRLETTLGQELRCPLPDLHFQVQSLPEAGRPPEFSGAIGQFELQAELLPSSEAGGDAFDLILRVSGTGNLSAVQAPRIDPLPGFEVLGSLETPSPSARAWTYHLRPRPPFALRVGPVALAYFDPTPPGSYRWAKSRALDVPGSASQEPGPGAPAAEPGPGAAGEGRVSLLTWALLGGLALLIVLGVERILRR